MVTCVLANTDELANALIKELQASGQCFFIRVYTELLTEIAIHENNVKRKSLECREQNHTLLGISSVSIFKVSL